MQTRRRQQRSFHVVVSLLLSFYRLLLIDHNVYDYIHAVHGTGERDFWKKKREKKLCAANTNWIFARRVRTEACAHNNYRRCLSLSLSLSPISSPAPARWRRRYAMLWDAAALDAVMEPVSVPAPPGAALVVPAEPAAKRRRQHDMALD